MPHKGKGRRSLTGAGDWEGHMQHRILPIDPLMQSLENQLFPAILKLPGMKRTFPVAVTGKTLKKNLDILGVASPEVIAAMRAGTLKTLNLTGKQLTKMVKEVSKRTTKLPAKPSTKPPPLKLPGSFSKMLSSAKPKSNVVPLRTRPGLQKEWSEMGKGVTRPSDVRGNPSIAGVEKSKPNVVPLPRSQNAKVKDLMQKLDPNSADYKALKAVTSAKTDLAKRSSTGKVLNLGTERLKRPGKPFKFPKARGGKIKKGYARGGGIRKPKW